MKSEETIHQIEDEIKRLAEKLYRIEEVHNLLTAKYKEAQRKLGQQEDELRKKNSLIKDFQKQAKKTNIVKPDHLEHNEQEGLSLLVGQCVAELDELIQELENER